MIKEYLFPVEIEVRREKEDSLGISEEQLERFRYEITHSFYELMKDMTKHRTILPRKITFTGEYLVQGIEPISE